jgi:hypothetical protein
MINTCYKLTDAKMQTYNAFQWTLNEWRTASGKGILCGPGWLHGYSDPLVALLHNPMHANIAHPRLFRAEWRGRIQDNHGLKFGVTAMRLAEELPVPDITNYHRRAYAIRCAIAVLPAWAVHAEQQTIWKAWAKNWIAGADSDASARNAAAAANAAANATTAYAEATAYAAYAATYAASKAYASANAADAVRFRWLAERLNNLDVDDLLLTKHLAGNGIVYEEAAPGDFYKVKGRGATLAEAVDEAMRSGYE